MVNYEYKCPICQKTSIRQWKSGRVVCDWCHIEFTTTDYEYYQPVEPWIYPYPYPYIYPPTSQVFNEDYLVIYAYEPQERKRSICLAEKT